MTNRYELVWIGGTESEMQESAYGGWVKVEDYDALQALNAELLEALENVAHAEMNSPIHENNSGCIKRMQGIARAAIAKARSQA